MTLRSRWTPSGTRWTAFSRYGLHERPVTSRTSGTRDGGRRRQGIGFAIALEGAGPKRG